MFQKYRLTVCWAFLWLFSTGSVWVMPPEDLGKYIEKKTAAQ